MDASDSVGLRTNRFYGLSTLQWRGVDKLKLIVADIKSWRTHDPLLKDEPINIVAHSQGTIITLAALQEGMTVDNVIFMGSPMDQDIVRNAEENTLLKIASANATSITNLWSSSDDVAALKGGIGHEGLHSSNITGNVGDIELAGVDHYGARGWWSGSWILNSANKTRVNDLFKKVLYGTVDASMLSSATKSEYARINKDAGTYIVE